MKRILYATITSAIAYAVTSALSTNIRRNQTERTAGKYGKVTVDYLDENGDSIRKLSANAPLFEVGDTVNVFNPFTGDSAIEDFDGSPLFYEVQTVSYDEKDETWRYTLDGEHAGGDKDEGFAEAWLVTPMFPMMTKVWNDGAKTTANPEGVGAVEKSKKDARIEEFMRQTAINYQLDVLRNSADKAEIAEANRRLTELVITKSAKSNGELSE